MKRRLAVVPDTHAAHADASSRRQVLTEASTTNIVSQESLTQIGVRAAAFNRLSTCAVVLDGNGEILDSNESWRLFTHLNAGDVSTTGPGNNYLEVCDRSAVAGDEDAAEVAAGLRQILNGERDRFDLEYPCPSPIEDRWFLLQASAAPVSAGSGVVVQHLDITAKKLAADALTALADNDALTGLPNRRSALRCLQEQIDSSAAEHSSVAVIFLDLDGFKEVNDSHGHHVGDELLVKVAIRLRRVLRAQDRLCRLGGDEFVLICPGLSEQAAGLVAHRVRSVMAAPFQIDDIEVVAGASVGVAVGTGHSSVEELIGTADAAMHLDKRGAKRRRELGRAVPKPSAAFPGPAAPLPPVMASIASANDGSLPAALTGLQARAAAAFAHSSDVVMFLALDGTVLSVSPATRAMFGVEPDELIGLNSLNLVHPDDQERMVGEVASIPNLGDSFRAEFRVIDKAGRTRWLEEIATNLVDDPNVGCVVGNVREVTERVQLLERIEADRQRLADAALAQQATHDWLTQLPNVASLHGTLQTALGAANADQHVALALIDIDDFKLVNDRNGHTIGDAALRGFADRLVAGLPHADLVARFDGDGFAVLRTNVASHDDAKQLGAAIVSLLHEPLTVGEHGVQVALTASVGVALSTDSDSSASLLRDADDALHHAKASGRNCVMVFDAAARSRAHRRRTLTAALPLALGRGELHVAYQPVIDLSTLTTAGFEALLRWQHPDLGTIAPLEFIPLAEASGEIVAIGDWVVEQAAHQLAVWRADRRTPEHLSMAINVSATQLAQPLFADRVVAIVRSEGLPRAAIHLEITESVLVDRIDNALRTIEELHSVGFNVSIDDFGTGYSSLNYLSRMPVDTLKIDRAFVAGLTEPGPAVSIVRTITALADALQLDTVAEGIELPQQLERLKELGCRYGQGFIWSAGLRPDDALAWMIEQGSRSELDLSPVG